MTQKSRNSRELYRVVTLTLIVSLVVWTFGFVMPVFTTLKTAEASNLSYLSDVMTNTAPNFGSNHTISFQSASSGVANGQTLSITFPVGFDLSQIVNADVDVATTSDFSTAANCVGTEKIGIAVVGQSLNLQFCAGKGGSIPTNTTTTIEIGTNATLYGTGSHQITNPATSTSYQIDLNNSSTTADQGSLRVAIIPHVIMSASIDVTLTFTVSGLATSTVVNGTSTTGNSTGASLAFGTLTPGVAKILGQQLTVATNARNGFRVTMIQNQNLLSSTGADIDLFRDANATSTPSPWSAPANTLDNENTYGHYGVTTDDADLGTDTGDAAHDTFGSSTFIGNITTPRVLFAHNGPADGVTQNKGLAQIAVAIQVTALQEAANDYQNVLTYVATPTY
jgi:hypothetical protein